MIVEQVVSAGSSSWTDSGVTVQAGDTVHIAAARIVLFGNSGSTVWGVATDIPGDPGGIDLIAGNLAAYPEGSYVDTSVGRALNPSACTNSALGGGSTRLAADVRPFCLAAKIAQSQPGWNATGCRAVERVASFTAETDGKIWLAFNDYQGCFANGSFFWVLIGKPSSGQTMASGYVAPDSLIVSSGFSHSSSATVTIKAAGLARTTDGLWWFAEGGYGSTYNTNPPHNPGGALTSYVGMTYPSGNLRPFCFGIKAGASPPDWGMPGWIEIGRGTTVTVGPGTVWVAWNCQYTPPNSLYGGWLVWIMETLEQFEPPVTQVARDGHFQLNHFVRGH